MFFQLAFLIYLIVRGYCHIAVWMPAWIKLRDSLDTVLFVLSIAAAVVLSRYYHTSVLTALAAAGFADIVLVQGRVLLDVVSDLCKDVILKAQRRR